MAEVAEASEAASLQEYREAVAATTRARAILAWLRGFPEVRFPGKRFLARELRRGELGSRGGDRVLNCRIGGHLGRCILLKLALKAAGVLGCLRELGPCG
jgi:hypothetical protein